MNHGNKGDVLPVSHTRLRRILGILGIALPVVLIVWGFALSGWNFGLLDSLSDYYGLRTRDAFVGIIFAIAWFLFIYRGYEKTDNVAGYLACVFALGAAFFPNNGGGWEAYVHYLSAAGLFLVLSFFSLFLFTKSKNSPKGLYGTFSGFRFGIAMRGDSLTPEKRIRNMIYVACGLVMLVCMALIPLYHWFWGNTAVSAVKPVLWLESFMIWAAGISWFIKGETLLRDKKQEQLEMERG